MKKYAFIINPVAGKMKNLDFTRVIHENSQNRDVSVKLFITEKPGHATEISKKLTASFEYDFIIAVGGDGTVNEIVNGFNLNSNCSLGILPWGSGNDVSRFLYGTKKINYFDVLFDDKLQTIVNFDVGCCKIVNEDETIVNKRFINAVGIGFDAYVAYLNRFDKKLTGILSYLIAVFRGLKLLQNLETVIEVNKNKIEGNYLLLTIGNGKTSGGGFYLNPDAIPTDGILNLTTLDFCSRFEVLKSLPSALVNKVKSVEKANFYTMKSIHIILKIPYYVHLDGEIGSTRGKEFWIELDTKKLRMIMSNKNVL